MRQMADLTERERQVARLVAPGLRGKEIARRLGISEQTVKNHLTHIFAKLGIGNRVELTRWVLEQDAEGDAD